MGSLGTLASTAFWGVVGMAGTYFYSEITGEPNPLEDALPPMDQPPV